MQVVKPDDVNKEMGMDRVTSDIMIEYDDKKRYRVNNGNPQKGKQVKRLLTSVGWKHIGSKSKIINGLRTTVAEYER